MNNIDPKDLLISLPFRGFISGSSGSGKSSFILKLLQNRSKIISGSFDRILYCSPCNFDFISEKDQQFHSELRKTVPFIEFVSSLPNLSDLLESNFKCTLLILEDMISDIISSQKFSQLYTSYSSHSNISVLTTTQKFL